jgi:uncharacterized RDD family membrane protein YckC
MGMQRSDRGKRRIVAMALDNAVAVVLGGVVAASLAGFSNAFRSFAFLSIYLAYFAVSEGLSGRTPGKAVRGLVVRRLDGECAGWREAFIRTGTRILEVNPLVGALPGGLAVWLSERNQRFGDMLAGTLVVRSKIEVSPSLTRDAELRERAEATARSAQVPMEERASDSTSETPCFVPAEGRARWTEILLIAGAAVGAAAVISGVMQLNLLSRAAVDGISESEAVLNDSRQQFIGILQFTLFVGTAVPFLMWFHRAHHNLPALGCDDLEYSPRWAVGGFFVPILNLARPFQVMREVWLGSMPGDSSRASVMGGMFQDRSRKAPPLVGWWWALFLGSNLFGNLTLRMAATDNPTLEQMQELTWAQILSDTLDVPAALLAAILVAQITRCQAAKAGIRAPEISSSALTSFPANGSSP